MQNERRLSKELWESLDSCFIHYKITFFPGMKVIIVAAAVFESPAALLAAFIKSFFSIIRIFATY